ncbi:MAG TPA: MFS transporter [Anaerolineales bacterium]|nr:MFS transporter [Anaerolineales bacterium]
MKLRGLWHHPDFLRLWAGQTVSSVGSVVTRTALPLTAVLVLQSQPAELGLLAAAGALPALLVGLAAGVWVDRVRRRPLMMAADLGRSILLLTIPLAAVAGVLRIGWLFVVAFLAGGLTVIFDVAYQAYVPSLVRSDQLAEANSKIGVSDSIAEIGGSALGGVLVQAITAPMAILVDAASFVLSAFSLAWIRTPEPVPSASEGGSWLKQARAGVETVRRDGSLLALAGASASGTLFGGFFGALYDLYALRYLAITPALLGLLVASGGVGALLGAAATRPAVARWGYGRILIVTFAAKSLAGLLIPLAAGPGVTAVVLLLTAQLFGDFALSMYFIAALTLRQAIAPPARLGRVNATMAFLEQCVAPLGLLAGGFIGQALGPRGALALGAAGGLSGAWILFRSPIRRTALLPTAQVREEDDFADGRPVGQ